MSAAEEKTRRQTRSDAVLARPGRQRRRNGVHQRDHMIDRLDDRLAQPLAIARQQSQPRIRAVDRALGRQLDERFRIASRGSRRRRKWTGRASQAASFLCCLG